ncbi:BglG family transcription antiterminator [Streptococcus dentasini]
MALVNRWYRILNLLVSQHQVTVEEVRKNLGISTKTLRSSIDQLNDILDADVQVVQRDDSLFLEVADYARLEEILSGSLRKESDFNSSSRRASYLIKRLLQSTKPLLIDDLAEEIGVSRTTINKDLKQVKELAKDYQVEISGRPNRGLEVFGDELNLRLFYSQHVYAYFGSETLKNETGFFLQELCQKFQLPRKIQDLLIKVVAITIARLRRGKFLTHPIPYYINELKGSQIMDELVYHLEMTYKISLGQYEQDFLSFPLNIQSIAGLEYCTIENAQIIALYQDMVERVRGTLDVDFNDEKLLTDIYTHLKFLLNRLVFHVPASDIFHGEIQNKFPLAFKMAEVAASLLREIFAYPVDVSEISYLALYFESILRDSNQTQERSSRKVAVVCTTGLGTAAMIARQLKNVLGNDVEITQYSEENFKPEADDNYFAIFTTVPLKYGNLKSPVIQLTNLFDDHWLRDIWQKIKTYHQKDLETTVLRFIHLKQAKSYKACLIEMTAVLREEHLVDDDFGKRILERDRQQSTIFGNGIAFPHAINHLADKPILMLGVLQDTLPTQTTELEFIFLVAIPQKLDKQIETELLELYDDIFRIANNDSLKEALRPVKTESDFIALTKSKGVF